MKLKSSMKWAIAAAATVTTVTVSMGVIDPGVMKQALTPMTRASLPETVSVFWETVTIQKSDHAEMAMILNLRIKSLRWSRCQNLH